MSATITMYGHADSGNRVIRKWDFVEEGSVIRHSDGALSFKFTDKSNNLAYSLGVRRVTLYGTYIIEYDSETASKP